MNLDDKIYNKVEELESVCFKWIDDVDSLGNQCAYTDRGIETIIDIAKELESLYRNGK